jgi:multiple sugar transport system permease protein
MTAVTPGVSSSDLTRAPHDAPPQGKKPGFLSRRPLTIVAELFMFGAALVWLLPVVFTLYVSLRPKDETDRLGYLSIARHLTLDNFVSAWRDSNITQYFFNSVLLTIPAVILALFFSSVVAFFVTRRSSKFNLLLLMMFTAGNLLPQQVVITPLFRLYLAIPLPDFISPSGTMYNSIVGLIAINAVFQGGFCVFVMSNYMRTVPQEMYEAALVDGASFWTRYWTLTLPNIRPALAALATLLTTWIYNDFFWAIALVSSGERMPITSALNSLKGEFISNQNQIAAAALLAAVPTLLIYIALQKQFVSGLTLGSTKG